MLPKDEYNLIFYIFIQEVLQIQDPPAVKSISERKTHQPYVNDFLPEYPEPHTYISTAALCSNAYKE